VSGRSTPLEAHLARLIEAEGPIPIARYMAECLTHPEHGYYRRGDPFGARGDFVTAPEISQIFGELIGLWLAERWDAMGRPAGMRLVELGPGRGSLMRDILRALQVMPEMLDGLSIHLVESNETLQAKQASGLGADAVWHARFEDIPPGPLFVIANEFFDALPVRQYVRTEQGWAERLVGKAEAGFEIVLGPPGPPPEGLPDRLVASAADTLVELCPRAEAVAEAVGARIAADGGAALVVDYGYLRSSPGESLQAVRRHQPVDIFDRPGESDLTAHVNFERLAAAGERGGALPVGPVTQGQFLLSLGIEVRAALLSRRADPRQAMEIQAAVRRLTAPDMMGELFKVLAFVEPQMGTHLPGFAEIGGG